MKNNHIADLIPEYLDNALSNFQKKEVEAHIKECEACKKELEELKILYGAFKKEKEVTPSARVRDNFYALLEDEKRNEHKLVALNPKAEPSKNPWVINTLKTAASIALLVGAFLFGKYQQETASNKEIALLMDERLEIKQMTMLSLMENKSASKRIQGVNYIEEFSDPDEDIVKALADRMRYDENSNVRLTAVDALRKFTASETVKNAFIAALKTEKDPSIQITIIQALVKIQERKAILPMKELLEREDTQPFVKEQIKSLLPSII